MHPLRLILINGKITESSNYPLEIWALDENNEKNKYYFKPFRQSSVNIYQTAKEIIACELSVLFDLPTPSYSILDISNSKLGELYTENELRKFYSGYKFCSKKLEQYLVFDSSVVSVGFLKDYEIINIFAFDLLIQNTDRGLRKGKPNLLINDNSLVMIDHELCLSFICSQPPSKLDYESYLSFYRGNEHVLYNHIRAIKIKSHIFDNFCDLLLNLDINSLDSVFNEMDKFNIEYGDRLDYYLYLNWCKNNVNIVKKYLLASV